MAGPLEWRPIQADFGGGGGYRPVNFIEGFDQVTAALKEAEDRKREEKSFGEVNKAMQISDPELLQKAMDAGNFKIDKTNYPIFQQRLNDLVSQQSTRLGMEETKGRMAGQKILDRNNEIVIKQNQQKLLEATEDWNLKLAQRKALPETLKRFAQIDDVARAGNPDGANRLMSHPTTIQMAIDAGMTKEDIDTMRKGFDTAATAGRTQTTERQDFAFEQAHRAQTEADEAAKREREAAKGFRAGVTDQQTWDEAQRNLAVTQERARKAAAYAAAGADRTEGAALRTERDTLAADKVDQDAKALVAKHESGPYRGDPAGIHSAILGDPTASAEVKTAASAIFGKAADAFAKTSQADFLAGLHEQGGPGATQGPRTRPNVDAMISSTPESRAAAGSIASFIDQTETGGSGDYSTLYGNAQKSGGKFEGFDVQTQTIGDLDRFAKRGYGDWVAANNNGVLATPMGRWQIVNSTLQDVAKRLGMSEDTVFDKNTQDTIFKYLVNQRLGNARTIEGAMNGMREEWAGLKNVPDADLRKAIEGYRNGSLSGFESLLNPTIARDEITPGPLATAAFNEIASKATPVTEQEASIIIKQPTETIRQSQQVSNAIKVDDVFGGQGAAILAEVMKPETNTKSVQQVANELKEKFPNIKEDQMTDNIQQLIDAVPGLTAGAAQALIMNSPKETYWFDVTTDQDTYIDIDQAKSYFKQFFDPNAANPGQGFLDALETSAAKNSYSQEIQTLQQAVADKMTNWIDIAARRQKDPTINDRRAMRELQYADQQLKAAIARAEADARNFANQRSAGVEQERETTAPVRRAGAGGGGAYKPKPTNADVWNAPPGIY